MILGYNYLSYMISYKIRDYNYAIKSVVKRYNNINGIAGGLLEKELRSNYSIRNRLGGGGIDRRRSFGGVQQLFERDKQYGIL